MILPQAVSVRSCECGNQLACSCITSSYTADVNSEYESQPGFRNWMPKIPYCINYPIFQWRQQCTQITITNMYSLIELTYTILIQCHGIDTWVREIQLYV